MDKTALVAGATGLVGSTLLEYLLNGTNYRRVMVLTRRPLSVSHPKLEEIIIDFDHLQQTVFPEPIDDAYCCLGTTIKKAGSREAFRKVDYEYPLEMARLAQKTGASQFLIITAMGAGKKSLFFYNRVKGEIEEALRQFNNMDIHIFRPSLLLGEREEQRAGEKIGAIVMKLISPLLIFKLKKYKPVAAKTVATAMYKIAQGNLTGYQVYESDKIKEIANGKIENNVL